MFYRGRFFWAQKCETVVKNQTPAMRTQAEAKESSTRAKSSFHCKKQWFMTFYEKIAKNDIVKTPILK